MGPIKARECSCCRRELVERNEDDSIFYRWNARLRKWFSRPIEPKQLFRTIRKTYIPEGQRTAIVWACTCGNLTEEKE